MREFILNELAKIENDNNVEILFAAEAGSRAWGFESPDSDYDVRFIYRRPAGYYLSVSEGYKTLRSEKDTIEVKNGDFDVVGWDIKKTLYLFGKSNPALLEWLTSPTIYSF
jgi:predicted nucleotidyltransferase